MTVGLDHRARAAWAVAAAGAVAVMAALGFGRFSYTILLPATREGLALGYTAAGLLGAANLVGYLAGSLASRTLTRWVGARATIAAGLAVLSLSLAWMGGVAGLGEAAMARALAGLAGGVVYVQALGLVAVWFPGPSKGLASGVMHCGNGLGLMLTGLGLPVVLGVLSFPGWRLGWLTLALGTALVLPLGWRYLRAPSAETTQDPRPPRPTRPGAHLGAYAGLYGLFGVSYIIYVTFFAEMLRSTGLSITETGAVWAMLGASSLASGPVWGSLSDRIGRLEGLTALFALQTVAYAVFLGSSFWGHVLSAGLFGLTAWGIPAIMAAATGDGRSREGAMADFGRITTVMGVGQALGPVLAGGLADVTGIVDSGLWLSIAAAIGGLSWSVAGVWSHRHASAPTFADRGCPTTRWDERTLGEKGRQHVGR